MLFLIIGSNNVCYDAGLDYLLLQKMKQDAKEARVALADGLDRSTVSQTRDISEVPTSTDLGARLKALMISGVVPCVNRLQPTSVSGLVCSRTAYEFDVDIMSEVDIPTTLSKSIKVWNQYYILMLKHVQWQ